MWVEFVDGSRPCSEGFPPSVFLPQKIPTFPIPVWPGNSKHEEPPRGMSTTTFPSLFPCHYFQVKSPLTSASLWSSVLISNPSMYGCRTSSVNTSLCILNRKEIRVKTPLHNSVSNSKRTNYIISWITQAFCLALTWDLLENVRIHSVTINHILLFLII